MKTKVKVVDLLGSVQQTAKGFIRQLTVLDITGGKSCIKLFAKTLDELPTKEGQEVLVEVNTFCFAAR